MTRKLVVLGAAGFIAKNLLLRLSEQKSAEIFSINRDTAPAQAHTWMQQADSIINLAGVNRAADTAEFISGNLRPVDLILDSLRETKHRPHVIHVSSSRAGDATPYGTAKLATEKHFISEAEILGLPLSIFRPPNVFGKWSKPNYNSAVATFCHNIARDLPITINDAEAILTLVYVDDLIDALLGEVERRSGSGYFSDGLIVHNTTVGKVANLIQSFHKNRELGVIIDVGQGLPRALYATYVAALPQNKYTYTIASHRDPRGAFSEVLKTQAAGQFSYFSALPGVTRGGHYHHSKVEKFLIVHGSAKFRFRHVLTDEKVEFDVSSDNPTIVETIPGWAHDVTNTGKETMVSLVWANEVFDRDNPDTYAAKVQ